MNVVVAWIQQRPGRDKMPGVTSLTEDFVTRIGRYTPLETLELADEAALLKQLDAKSGRTPPFLIMLDARGQQMTSESFAEFFADHQMRGTQTLLFAVGGPDGFMPEARRKARLLLSLGKMTLPHELARVVLLEQVYRAFTILKGHPYHTGH
ncbi:MAG: 23S rRNA (pseudouridine(1915)-N(3))-methyltransferase RlmH [Acidobacteriales bacterium]|nr:23S rRNA (pseudouridine(1915)-N(3))-methyltransferase RlmH [Terriglobales bacterium]